MIRLSIIIPAYNEEKRIGKTLEEYLAYFSRAYGEQFELIVVLNGCKDDTIGVVQRYRKYAQLRYKDIPEAVGKGGALIQGFKMARGRLVGFVDADGATAAAEFARVVDALNDADGIIASRWIRGAVVQPPQPLSRRVASRAFNLIVRVLFGLHMRDTQCGSKIFRREAVMRVLPELGTTNWAFDIDLLYLMKRHRLKVVEVPARWKDRGGSTLNIPKAALEMFLAVVRLRLVYSPLTFLVASYDTIVIGLKKVVNVVLQR